MGKDENAKSLQKQVDDRLGINLDQKSLLEPSAQVS